MLSCLLLVFSTTTLSAQWSTSATLDSALFVVPGVRIDILTEVGGSSFVCGALSSDTLNWFPYKTGDMWEYWVNDGVIVDTAQIVNIKDSVAADGKIHLTQRQRSMNPMLQDRFLRVFHYVVDTGFQEVLGPSDELTNVLVYRFNVQQGDQWTMDPRGEMVTVTSVFEDTLFGTNTTFMQLRYHNGDLSRYYDLLAKGFGLVERFPAEPGGFWYKIKGAVINGVLYGDTTNVVTSVADKREPSSPQTIELHQNFPNPFNLRTTIRFDLKASSHVSLTIYDCIGREVMRLIDHELLSQGIHSTVWNGMNRLGRIVSSGVYFYRLDFGANAITRSMILLK